MFSPAKDLAKAQGLEPNRPYHGKVVDNEDPTFRGRVRVRIDGIMDGIPDNKLPWSVPLEQHHDGASERSGTADIPKKDTKVLLRFQDGNPLFPVLDRDYPVETTNVQQEVKRNYPDRKVHRLQNKSLVVLDTKTNEAFIRAPGDVHLYIDGNLHMEVKGNVVEKIHGNVDRHVIGNVQETVEGNYIKSVEGNEVEIVQGHRHTRVEKDHTDHVQGSRSLHIEKDSSEAIDGMRSVHLVGNDTLLVEADQDHSILGKRTTLVQAQNIERYMDDFSLIISGNLNSIVEKSMTETVKERHEVYVEGSAVFKVLNDYALLIEGKTTLASTGDLLIRTPANMQQIVEGGYQVGVGGFWEELAQGDYFFHAAKEDRVIDGDRYVTVGGAHFMTPADPL